MYIVVIVISVIFIATLFNLQIVNGENYREQSEKRMLRTKNITAPRGEIYDRNGVILATNKLSYDVELYKVRVSTKEQNDGILRLVEILNENSDKVYSTFPVNDDLNGFNFENDEEEQKWKKEMKFDSTLTFDQVIDKYIEKYELQDYSDNRLNQIKMIEIKYEANLNGYSLFNSATIAKDISQKSVAKIGEEKYKIYGISIVSVPKRYYPNGNLLSHTIGYVSKISSTEYEKKKEQGYNVNSVIGKAGIEQSFEKYLRGNDGVIKEETDTLGNVSSQTETTEAKSGDNVTLTIDYRLQKVAEESLLNTINGLQNGTLVGKKFSDANAGAVVVLDVDSGEVLASASYPTYDINSLIGGISIKDWNALQNNSLHPMVNRVVSGIYSPGSTFKMLVGMAGLMNGKITVDEKYYDPGIYPYGYHPKCWLYTDRHMTHGWINIEGAIKGSCNCYFYEVGRRIGISEIVKYAKLFGLGQKTGIELSGEAAGTIAGADDKSEDGLKSPWYLGDTLSAAIGQSGSSYTPIQLANYIATIANGGKLNKVSLIKSVDNEVAGTSESLADINKYTSEYTGVNFEEKDLNINSEYIDAIKKGMLSVTSETGGTSYIVFKNSDIQVAGKTGTAQVPNGNNNGIFVGFAPYDNPKIAVVAVIQHGGEGTYTANVVKPIMEEYFNIDKESKQNEKAQNVSNQDIKF
ncbi:penicillin-binding protein 2 [Clostridium sp. CAG:465]|nr:penicillin-binding protein 2 [Clostridium sp. CAG:465]